MLSMTNQNKFVDHMVRQLKQYPHSPLMTMQLQAKFTFGSTITSEIDDNKLILWLGGVSCILEKKENQWNVIVDGDIVDVVYFT